MDSSPLTPLAIRFRRGKRPGLRVNASTEQKGHTNYGCGDFLCDYAPPVITNLISHVGTDSFTPHFPNRPDYLDEFFIWRRAVAEEGAAGVV